MGFDIGCVLLRASSYDLGLQLHGPNLIEAYGKSLRDAQPLIHPGFHQLRPPPFSHYTDG